MVDNTSIAEFPTCELGKKSLRHAKKSMLKHFNNATQKEIKKGRGWYPKINKLCKKHAKNYDTDSDTVAGIIASLSPRNRWERNLEDAITVLDAVRDNVAPEDVSCGTYHKGKFKAFAVARKEVFIKPSSQKVYAFCQNIAQLNSDFVTIDVWHIRACGFNGDKGVGTVAYRQLHELTLQVAKDLGLKGYEFQAIVWESIRNSQ